MMKSYVRKPGAEFSSATCDAWALNATITMTDKARKTTKYKPGDFVLLYEENGDKRLGFMTAINFKQIFTEKQESYSNGSSSTDTTPSSSNSVDSGYIVDSGYDNSAEQNEQHTSGGEASQPNAELHLSVREQHAAAKKLRRDDTEAQESGVANNGPTLKVKLPAKPA